MPRYASSSSSESDSGDITFEYLLKGVGMARKYGKLFSRAKIMDLDDAKDLSDRKLKKIGVLSSTERRKILKAIASVSSSGSSSYDSESDSSSDSSDSEDEQNEVEQKLSKAGLDKYSRKFAKAKLTSLKSARRLNHSKLKSMGIESSRTRAKLLRLFSAKTSSSSGSSSKKSRRNSDGSATSATMSSSSRGSGSSKRSKTRGRTAKAKSEKTLIKDLLRDAELESETDKLFDYGITNLAKALELDSDILRTVGIDKCSTRSRVLNALRPEVLNKLLKSKSSKSSGNSSCDSDAADENSKPLLKALQRVNMQKHFRRLCRQGVDSVAMAQGLDHDKLLDLGVQNEGQRSLMLECFLEADWKCDSCSTWNEHRKTCSECQKIYRPTMQLERASDDEDDAVPKFEEDDKVKYVGKSRPTTKSGTKGEVHRVLESGKFYMVRFPQKDGKVVKIRLARSELKPVKDKRKRW